MASQHYHFVQVLFNTSAISQDPSPPLPVRLFWAAPAPEEEGTGSTWKQTWSMHLKTSAGMHFENKG